MAGRLSFAIAVNLMTEQFKKGANQVRASFRAIKAETVAFAAALGAGGIGLTELVGRFAQVARETSRVTTALKNVSGGTAQYADNLSYVTRLAKQYGLEVNALTSNYARFIATANVSGMSLLDQRKIFESLSRASTAFGLSAEQTNYVFTALSQMMSKGKISSEELRQQMGEQLPVALQAMAKAAGVSMGELDKLLQQGQLMSADILPKFADALNELIPNVSTDNLESSINRLQNTFTDLVNSSGVQGFYKRAVELVDSLLQHVRDGVTGIVAFVATMIGLKMVANIAGYFQKINQTIAGTVTAHQRAEEQKLLATQNTLKAQQRLKIAETAYANASADQQLAAYDRMEKAKTALARAQANERRAVKAAEQAAEAASAANATTVWGKAMTRIKMAIAGVATALKGAFMSFGITAIITAISALVGYLVNVRKEAERVRNIFSDYQKEAAKAGVGNQEISRLQTLQSLYEKANGNLQEQQKYRQEIEKMLGRQIGKEEDINTVIAERIKLLEATARADFYAQKKTEYEDRNREVAVNAGMSEADLSRLVDLRGVSPRMYRQRLYQLKDNGADVSAIDKAVNEYARNLLVVNDALTHMEEAVKSGVDINRRDTVTTGGTTAATPAQSELEKQQQRYAQSLRELEARREVEKMSTDEYSKALDELNRQSLIAARATGDREVLESQYLQTLQQAVNNPAYSRAQAELAAVQAEYAETQRTAKARLDARLITEEQYRAALSEAATSAALAAVSINGIGNAADGFVEKMRNVATTNAAPIEMPTLGTRDATFDYKKSGTDIGREKLEIWIEYRDNLRGKLEEARKSGSDLAGQLASELDNAIANVTSLQDALKIAEVQEDVEELHKELNKGIYSGMKDIASSADRTVSAFQNAVDVLNDADASGWEKVLAVWNALTQTVDSILSIGQAIETVTDIVKKLGQAEKTEAAIQMVTTAQKVAANKMEMTSNIAAEGVAKSTATTEIAANTAKGTSAAAASAANLPFPANLIAIGAAIAAVIALFASIPKFATGGVVTGGAKSGDKLLARVNAGEMILNPAQQSNLFRMLNEGRTTPTGRAMGINIGFDRVRGSDIYLALKNYMKSTGKTL